MTGLLKLLVHSLWNLLRQMSRFLLSAFILVKREPSIVKFGFGTVTQISTPVLLPGKPCGRRSPVGYSPWGRKELDMTERLHFHSGGLLICTDFWQCM